MSASDPSGALAAYFLTTSVGTVTGGRVFRPELDTDEAGAMPQACVVIRRAGGYQMFGRGTVPLGDPRLDIFCYGESPFAAEQLAGEVINALRAMRTCVFQRTRLLWARVEGGPVPIVDPETNWPCSVLSAQVAHTEPALA